MLIRTRENDGSLRKSEERGGLYQRGRTRYVSGKQKKIKKEEEKDQLLERAMTAGEVSLGHCFL